MNKGTKAMFKPRQYVSLSVRITEEMAAMIFDCVSFNLDTLKESLSDGSKHIDQLHQLQDCESKELRLADARELQIKLGSEAALHKAIMYEMVKAFPAIKNSQRTEKIRARVWP